MKLYKIATFLIANTLLATPITHAAEEQEWGEFGRRKVYSISKCMNNFKYCTQAQSADVSESRRDKGERDCGEFVQFCEPIFQDVCDAMKRTGYDCGTPEYLQDKFEEQTIRGIEVGENKEFTKKIKEALKLKKAEDIINEKNKEDQVEAKEKAEAEAEEKKKNTVRKISIY
ncbi:MAG: hypothetical protein N4A44_00375 [Alphaproteobacteria bacterium]|jgi:hypothetical protein|nr:hypothetical protein [Alphaproteobacteria bacterium]